MVTFERFIFLIGGSFDNNKSDTVYAFDTTDEATLPALINRLPKSLYTPKFNSCLLTACISKSWNFGSHSLILGLICIIFKM